MNTEFDQDLVPHMATEATAVHEPYRMRCPSCKKLYSVEIGLLGAEDLSKFECVSCQATFFALRPELNGAHFLETHELETQFAPLASSLPTIDGFADGPVNEPSLELEPAVRAPVLEVPTDLREKTAQDIALAEKAELVMMWQALQEDYENTARHEAFVALCAKEGQLVYAAHKYAQVLMLAPQELIARQMRSRVQGLATYGFDALDNGTSAVTWSFPLPSFNNLIIFMGSILVVVGFGFPNMRQTAGLGFAMIALAIGLRVYLRRPRI